MEESPQTAELPLVATGVIGALLVVIIIAIVILARRSRALKKKIGYPKGKQVRLLALLFLEPPLEFLIIFALLWAELTTDFVHVAVALLAILPGILLGRYRANESFVEALPEHRAVVTTHTRGELLGFLAIVAIKVLEGNAENVVFPYWLTLILTAGLVVILSESAARVFALYKKYEDATPEKSANSL